MKTCFALALASLLAGAASAKWEAAFDTLVLDADAGKPVPGCVVHGHFEAKNGWTDYLAVCTNKEDRQTTDAQGRCRLRGRTNTGHVSAWVEKAASGYYAGGNGGWSFDLVERNATGAWQPENLVATLMVRRVVHPIPLVVRRVGRNTGESVLNHLAETNRFATVDRIQYDLVQGDWLPPLGKGEVADIEFAKKDEAGGMKGDWVRQWCGLLSVQVHFPGADNGLVEAKAHLCAPRLREAPEDGYQPDYLAWWKRDRPGGEIASSIRRGRVLAFRIRSRRDAQGRLVDGLYGKIYGDFRVLTYTMKNTDPKRFDDLKDNSNAKRAPTVLEHMREMREHERITAIGDVSFQYYLNPTSLDRNLEWEKKVFLEWNRDARRLEEDRVDSCDARRLSFVEP